MVKDHKSTGSKSAGSKGPAHRRKSNGNRKENGSRPSSSSSASTFFHRRKTELVFDADARQKYLTGFSERKRQRRAFGLAMQKVKDRQAKLERRAATKKAWSEQIEQAEQQQQELLLGDVDPDRTHLEESENDEHGDENEHKVDDEENDEQDDDGGEDENDRGGDDENDTDETILPKSEDVFADDTQHHEPTVTATTTATSASTSSKAATVSVQTYQDLQTQAEWGGEVIVKTSTRFPGDSDNDHDDGKAKKARKKKGSNRPHSIDKEQQYAGSVDRYLHQLGAAPSGKKKNKTLHKAAAGHRHKGKHGAASMKGMASGRDWKIAQKALQQAQGATGGGGPKGKSPRHRAHGKKR